MINGRNLYVLPVTENGESLSYYCLVNFIVSGCTWMLIREEKLLSHGVCDKEDVPLMLNSLLIDLSMSEDNQEWENTSIH